MKKLIINFVVLLSFLTVLSAQKGNYTNHPGYVDFTKLEKFNVNDGSNEIIVEEKLLRMVGKMTKGEDAGLSDLLNSLKLVKAISFDVTKDNFKEMYDKMVSITNKLDSMGWDRVVKSKAADKLAYVFVKTKGEDDVIGLAVLALDKDGQASFVNVVGDINMDAIGRLSNQFKIPALDNVKPKK